jgi:hypothetical protein
MSRRLAVLVILAGVLATSGCGEADDVVRVEAVEPSYDGPLYVTRADAKHPSAGAAGEVIDCATWGDGGFSDQDVYGEGATAASADGALDVARSERGFGGVQEGLLVAKKEEDRILYVLDVAGQLKQAVIVRNGPATEGAGGAGWYVESWAHCDYSELPRSFADSIGLQIWTDSDGQPVATTTIESWVGPEHCDWQSMTFLFLGKAVYVRDPQPELGDYFAEPYDESARLPKGALRTGFERDGQRLWLSQDKQRAFVGAAEDVEVWPRAVRELGCD